MSLSPWLLIRQAREALAAGRPDDAHRLLDPLLAAGHRKAWKLARDVAKGYVARGEKALRLDNPEAAWRELLAAESLNTGDQAVAKLRGPLAKLGLATVRAALDAGNPPSAADAAVRLRDRGVRDPELATLEDAAQDWVLAGEMADRGDFLLALVNLDRVRPRLGGRTAGLDRFRQTLEARHERLRTALGKLHEAAEAGQWRDALSWSAEALAAAPQSREARALRRRAWAIVNPDGSPYTPDIESVSADAAAVVESLTGTRAERKPVAPGLSDTAPNLVRNSAPAAEPEAEPPPVPLPKRFLLWIDGVGGYLVCTAPRVTFGQAISAGPVDVPLFADVSRLHAELSRDAEGYVLESARGIQVNGADAKRAILKPGDRVTLGATCQFVFHFPVPVSPSVRLELVSGHRLPIPVDGVILMADNLILGPGPQAHVTVPDLSAPVSLYRSKDGLGVRWAGGFRVDNQPCQGRSSLPIPAVVSGPELAFALEPVGARL